MKKLITIIALCFMHLFYAQYPVANMQNVDVNGNRISDCGTIAFGTGTTVTIVFDFKVTKAASFDVGQTATFKLYRKYDNSSTEVELDGLIVNNSAFIQGTNWTGTFSKVLQSSDFPSAGGTVYGRYTYNGGFQTTCFYPVTKSSPSFSLSPTTTSIACGETGNRTFTVTPSNIPSGVNVTYSWLYSGWNQVSTTTTSRTLQIPAGTALPSSIYVTPSINGLAYPQLSCIVSRAPFTSTATINGASSLCTSATYSISTLPAGQSVTSWSVQGSSLAVLSARSGPTVTLTKGGNGTVTLVATITNACGETVTKSKTIIIGLLPPPTTLTGPSSVGNGSLKNYQTTPVAGASSYVWWLPYPYDTVPIFDYFGQNWAQLENSTDTSIQVFTGYSGVSGVVQVMAVNACGRGSAKSISVTHTGGAGGPMPRLSNPIENLETKIYPNPANNVINLNINSDIASTKVIAFLYDLLGRKIQEIEVIDAVASFNVEDIPNGNYILKLEYNGEVETHQIIIE